MTGINDDSVEASGNIYIPHDGEKHVDVWAVDPHLKLFSNITEDHARNYADENPHHIFFFAQLAPPDWADREDQLLDQIVHRDAGSGQFVTGEYAEENPETTVTERNNEN